jgi:cytochrome d ubiquinol oxidase subunit II
MVMLLAVCLGALYMINNIADEGLCARLRRCLLVCGVMFVAVFLIVAFQLMTMDGFAVGEDNVVSVVEGKYWDNLMAMPIVLVMLVVGALLIVGGMALTVWKKNFRRGIWLCGPGTLLAVMALFMLAGYNGTAYYPSTADLQSSLTIANSCSSEFTLRTMAIVSLIIPFVVAYIAYFWRKMDKKPLTTEELSEGEKY